HLPPAGTMFQSAARAVGAAVLPAGTGQTELQVRAAADIGTTAYSGTPDYLKVILDKADEMGVALGFTRALVSGCALFPSLRQGYADRGIATLQCYATADVGLIAYESEAMEGMIVDEGVIVEIVRPGTGDPVPEGEVGEVLVTTLNPDYP
ncbi:phenylacetate--CoA ligase family protein, partial [Pseudomonas sp. 32_A]|uniref:phenylacetate--CoA ligase family protein n=1 Tax=Pseudomonas sp. 32_A TaxID=2813559 RepID=UPI001A9E96E0